MSLDLGDSQNSEVTLTRTFDSDNSGSAGDAVKWDETNERVTPVTAAGDTIFGILVEDSPSTAGDPASVVVFGPVLANATSGLEEGDVTEAEGTNNGRLAANAPGRRKAVDEGGTETYNLAMGNPWCVTASGGTLDDGTSLGTNEAEIFMK